MASYSSSSFPFGETDPQHTPVRISVRSASRQVFTARQAPSGFPPAPVPTLADVSFAEIQARFNAPYGAHEVYVRSTRSGLWHAAYLIEIELTVFDPPVGKVRTAGGRSMPLHQYGEYGSPGAGRAASIRVALADFPDADFRIAATEVTWHLPPSDQQATGMQLETSFEEMIAAQEQGIWRP